MLYGHKLKKVIYVCVFDIRSGKKILELIHQQSAKFYNHFFSVLNHEFTPIFSDFKL